MPAFASKRERRWWLLALLAVAGIWTTLGWTPLWAEALSTQNLQAAAFLSAMALIAAAAVVLGLRTRARVAEIGVALGVAAVYVMVLTRLTLLAERTHLLEYGVVALLIDQALAERLGNGRPVPVPPLLAVLAVAVLGSVEEGIQAFLPNRVFDPVDIGFNALAGLMAVTARVCLSAVRRRSTGRIGRRTTSSSPS